MNGGSAKRVIRIDAGALRSPVETPQGFLRVDGYAGRVGVYEYMNEDGTTRRELRPPSEVHKSAALGGFEGAPLTDGHPMEPVTIDNVKSYEVGTTTGARRDGDNVAVSMVIKDPKTIAKAKKAKQDGKPLQLSPGYALDLDETPGVDPRFGRYDAIQRNIEINHLALVADARGGPGMNLRMDAARAFRADGRDVRVRHDDPKDGDGFGDWGMSNSFAAEGADVPTYDGTNYDAVMAAMKKCGMNTDDFEKKFGNTDRGEKAMTTTGNQINHDEALRSLEAQRINLDRQVTDLTKERDELKLRADTAEGKLVEVEKQVVSLRGEVTQVRAASETVAVKTQSERADTAEGKLIALEQSRKTEIRARVALERKCAVTLGEGFRMDQLSDRQIRELVVKKLDSGADTSPAVPDGVIIGRFEAACDRRDANASSLARVSETLAQTSNADAAKSIAAKKAEEWMKPLPNSVHSTSQR